MGLIWRIDYPVISVDCGQRRTSRFNTTRIDHIRDKLIMKYGDLTDSAGLANFLIICPVTLMFNL